MLSSLQMDGGTGSPLNPIAIVPDRDRPSTLE